MDPPNPFNNFEDVIGASGVPIEITNIHGDVTNVLINISRFTTLREFRIWVEYQVYGDAMFPHQNFMIIPQIFTADIFWSLPFVEERLLNDDDEFWWIASRYRAAPHGQAPAGLVAPPAPPFPTEKPVYAMCPVGTASSSEDRAPEPEIPVILGPTEGSPATSEDPSMIPDPQTATFQMDPPEPFHVLLIAGRIRATIATIEITNYQGAVTNQEIDVSQFIRVQDFRTWVEIKVYGPGERSARSSFRAVIRWSNPFVEERILTDDERTWWYTMVFASIFRAGPSEQAPPGSVAFLAHSSVAPSEDSSAHPARIHLPQRTGQHTYQIHQTVGICLALFFVLHFRDSLT